MFYLLNVLFAICSICYMCNCSIGQLTRWRKYYVLLDFCSIVFGQLEMCSGICSAHLPPKFHFLDGNALVPPLVSSVIKTGFRVAVGQKFNQRGPRIVVRCCLLTYTFHLRLFIKGVHSHRLRELSW